MQTLSRLFVLMNAVIVVLICLVFAGQFVWTLIAPPLSVGVAHVAASPLAYVPVLVILIVIGGLTVIEVGKRRRAYLVVAPLVLLVWLGAAAYAWLAPETTSVEIYKFQRDGSATTSGVKPAPPLH